MKRRFFTLTVAIMALMLVSAGLSAQETPPPKSAEEKQKQAEYKKQQALQEELKQKQAEFEAKRKEIQEKVADQQEKLAERKREYEWVYRDFDDLDRQVRGLTRNMPMVVVPDVADLPDIPIFRSGSGNNLYLYGGPGYGSKPGTSWNYSRQVMEATFTNELAISADEGQTVNLTVSGDCAEGTIAVAIIMPDGKQLSEVILDENGSLNWRKSYEAGEDSGWKNGKWTFRIKAKNATGNLRIAMSSY
jgi:hypothetical protein